MKCVVFYNKCLKYFQTKKNSVRQYHKSEQVFMQSASPNFTKIDFYAESLVKSPTTEFH